MKLGTLGFFAGSHFWKMPNSACFFRKLRFFRFFPISIMLRMPFLKSHNLWSPSMPTIKYKQIDSEWPRIMLYTGGIMKCPKKHVISLQQQMTQGIFRIKISKPVDHPSHDSWSKVKYKIILILKLQEHSKLISLQN